MSPHLRFGIAFCEASTACLIRRSGNDAELTRLAVTAAQAISAGHAFVIMLANGYPINVMNQVKAVPEVCTIFCATANPVEILLAITDRGRGIIGVVDGSPPVGAETDADAASRTACCAISGTSSEPPTRAGRARPATRRSFYARSLVRPALQDRLTAIGGVSPLFHRLRRLILQAHPGAGGHAVAQDWGAKPA